MFELLVFVVGLVLGVVYHAYLNPYVTRALTAIKGAIASVLSRGR